MRQATVTHTQSQAPASVRLKRDPSRHYIIVQDDDPSCGYKTPLCKMQDMASPNDDNEFMYRVESTNALDTGDRSNTLLSCSLEDYETVLKENDAKALLGLRPTNNPDESSFTSITQQGKTVSSEQLF